MRIKNSLKNISSGIIGQFVLLLTNFLSRTVFISILGSTYLGVSGLFGNILKLLSLAELGVGQAITFSLYKPLADNDTDKIYRIMNFYKKVYRFMFCFVLVVGLLLTPFLQYIIKDINKIQNIHIIYAMYVVNSATSYLFVYKNTLVVAAQKNYELNKIAYKFQFVIMFAQILVLILFKNYLLYLFTQISLTIALNIINAKKADKIFPFLKEKRSPALLLAEEKSQLTKNIRALMIYKVGTLALNSTDNILISMFVGITKVGLYSNYTLITTSVTSFLSTIFGNITASIGNLNATESKEKKISMFNNINFATFWLYTVCSVCIFCVTNPFIEAWIGAEYLLSMRELFIIVLNSYIAGMLFAPYDYRQTMGLFVYGKMRPIISAIINLISSIVLGKYFGLEGILWGTAIARLTTNVWFDPYIVFKKGLNTSPLPYFIDYLLKALCFFINGAFCYIITSLIPTFPFSFIVNAIITFLLSNMFLFIIYRKSLEFKYFYNLICSMFRKIKR